MSYQKIGDALLRRVYDAAVKVGQSRDALLTGIPPEISLSLPVLRSRGDTLWSDLNQLNQMGPLLDGTVPLVTWLKNAKLLAGPRVESRVFQEALVHMGVSEQKRNDPHRHHPDNDAFRGERSAEDPFMGGNRGGNEAHRPGHTEDPRRVPVTTAGAVAGTSDIPEVVVLHAPEDDSFAAALRTHAAVLRNTKKALLWFQSDVRPDENRDRVIGAHIARNRVVMVLFSASFIASDALAVAESALDGGKRVIPILIRACDWKSTGLGGLTVLPRNNVPIAQHSNPDQAYADIIGELRDLLERLPPDTPAATQQPVPPEKPPTQLVTVEQVFPVSGPPELTYVEPAEHVELVQALRRPDRGLIVEGPSTIGKSTAIARALAGIGKPFTHLLPGDPEIATLQRPEDVKGWLVIDDFHQLDEARKKQMAQLLKWMVDKPSGGRKVILVGVGEVARSVLALNTNLMSRFDNVRIKRQPDSRVEELLAKGEIALNITFQPRSVITVLANGSFALAQQLASRAVTTASISSTRPRKTGVEVSRAGLVDKMLLELRLSYGDALSELLHGDRATPRGVYLAILWMLSRRDDDGVPLGEVVSKYEQFTNLLDALGPDRLMAPLRQPPVFSECLRIDRQRVTIVDPRFAFFLRNESFAELIRAGGLRGVAHINTDGLLEYRHPGHSGPSPGSSGSPMWAVRDADLFWPRADVRALLDLLSSAYGGDIRHLLDVAETIGIPRAAVPQLGRAPTDVVRDVVDQGRLRGLLKNLLEELQQNSRIAGYRSELETMLGTPDREQLAQ